MTRIIILLFTLPFLSGAQMQLQNTPEPPVTGSAGCWDFNGNALDHSGNNNHGKASNVVYVADRFNQPNAAAYFNGSNSQVVVPNSASIDFSNNMSFSFTYWQKTYPGNVNSVIITKHTYGNWDGYNFIANNQSNAGYCTGTDHMYWYVAAGGQEDACSDGPVLNDSLWHFVAGVYDGVNNKSYLYIDAVLQADVGRASGTSSSPANLFFGFDGDINDLYFHGVLDDACLYPRLLTSSEIQEMYNTITGNESVNAAEEISVHPNPSSGDFYLSLNKEHKLKSGEIFNQVGQRVMIFQISSDQMALSCDLPPGVYFINLRNAAGSDLIEKLVIVR